MWSDCWKQVNFINKGQFFLSRPKRPCRPAKASKVQNVTQYEMKSSICGSAGCSFLLVQWKDTQELKAQYSVCDGNEMSNICLTTVNSTTAILLNHPSVAPMYSYNIFTNTWSKKYQQIPIFNFYSQIISCVLYQGKNYQRYRLFFVRNTHFCIN